MQHHSVVGRHPKHFRSVQWLPCAHGSIEWCCMQNPTEDSMHKRWASELWPLAQCHQQYLMQKIIKVAFHSMLNPISAMTTMPHRCSPNDSRIDWIDPRSSRHGILLTVSYQTWNSSQYHNSVLLSVSCASLSDCACNIWAPILWCKNCIRGLCTSLRAIDCTYPINLDQGVAQGCEILILSKTASRLW